MVKIVSRVEHQIDCQKCGAKLEYSYVDVKRRPESNHYIVCPACKKWLPVEDPNLEGFTADAESSAHCESGSCGLCPECTGGPVTLAGPAPGSFPLPDDVAFLCNITGATEQRVREELELAKTKDVYTQGHGRGELAYAAFRLGLFPESGEM